MLEFSGRGILLDIEGTTSAVSYVYDIMFPFARTGLDAYLDQHWGDATLAEVCDQIAHDAGQASLASWASDGNARDVVRTEVIRLMDADIKATGLKQLQGLIWEAGFKSGELQAHVYDDVPPALSAWRDAGVDIRIYSSGSVHAQKLFFGHSVAGDLLPCFSGHYDTTTGPKREAGSYNKIIDDWKIPAADLLFLSDVVEELDAARAAGMQTGLALRPGNAEVADANAHATLRDFSEVNLGASN